MPMQQVSDIFRHPLVTFAMPAYNAAAFLGDAIDSVRAQSFRDWELIIVDDCSSDNTAAIARRYALKDPRITVLRTERQSGSAFIPRKMAVEAARTDLICAVDADDIIAPDYLEQLLRRKETSDADIVYSTLWTLRPDGGKERRLPFDTSLYDKTIEGRSAVKLTLGDWKINTNGALKKKSLYMSLYNDMPDFPCHTFADELLTRHLIFHAHKVAFSRAAYYHRSNPGSITNTTSTKQLHYIYNNLALISFTRLHYSGKSEEYLLAQKQNFFGYYGALLRLQAMRPTGPEANEVSSLMTDARKAIDFQLLRKHISWKYRLLHLLPAQVSVILLKAARRAGL